MKPFRIVLVALCMVALSGVYGCAAKVGSPEWCTQMKEKPKGDWTANELADFAKHCVLK